MRTREFDSLRAAQQHAERLQRQHKRHGFEPRRHPLWNHKHAIMWWDEDGNGGWLGTRDRFKTVTDWGVPELLPKPIMCNWCGKPHPQPAQSAKQALETCCLQLEIAL